MPRFCTRLGSPTRHVASAARVQGAEAALSAVSEHFRTRVVFRDGFRQKTEVPCIAVHSEWAELLKIAISLGSRHALSPHEGKMSAFTSAL